jgi:hypothetical protein
MRNEGAALGKETSHSLIGQFDIQADIVEV